MRPGCYRPPASLALTVAFLLFGPAYITAGGPERTPFSTTVVGADLISIDSNGQFYVVTCSGVVVKRNINMYGTVTTWRNGKGEVIHTTLEGTQESEFYLDSGLGTRVSGIANYHVFTLGPGLEKWTGVFWHVVIPGVGAALIDAGLEIIDWNQQNIVVKASGHHQWLEGDFDKMCAALQ